MCRQAEETVGKAGGAGVGAGVGAGEAGGEGEGAGGAGLLSGLEGEVVAGDAGGAVLLWVGGETVLHAGFRHCG